MKILITGAHGMLGHALQSVFKDQEVVTWDRAELDITNSADVIDKVSALRPEIILNAAAYTDVDGAETEQELAFSINEQGVKNLAEVAKKIQALLVHYSTDYVFPGDKAAGYTEDDQPGPAVNVYGNSKLKGEQALQIIQPSYYLIRTAWLYGPYGKNFVETMKRLAQSKTELSVVGDQHGSPTFTFDVAQATWQLIEQNYPTGIYHLVNSGQTTWADFARKIFELAQLPTIVKTITSGEYVVPARRPAYSILKNTKGPTLRSWEEALAEYLTM